MSLLNNKKEDEINYFKEPSSLHFTLQFQNDFTSLHKYGKFIIILKYVENMFSPTRSEISINSFGKNNYFEFTPNRALNYKSEDSISMNALYSQTEYSSSDKVYSVPSTSNNKREYAQRRDVVYKTLLRNTRRYLFQSLQAKTPEAEFSIYTRGCLVFEA